MLVKCLKCSTEWDKPSGMISFGRKRTFDCPKCHPKPEYSNANVVTAVIVIGAILLLCFFCSGGFTSQKTRDCLDQYNDKWKAPCF